MLGNLNLGVYSLGTGSSLEEELNYGVVLFLGLEAKVVVKKSIKVDTAYVDVSANEVQTKLKYNLDTANIDVVELDAKARIKESFEIESSNVNLYPYKPKVRMKIRIDSSTGYAKVTSYPITRRLIVRIKPIVGNVDVIGLPVHIFYTKRTPTLEQYLQYLRGNLRTPIYKIEILRKEDETVMNVIEGEIINNSGAVTNTLDEGVRRTCDFTLPNYDNRYSEFINNISIGDKFKLYLGYKIDGIDKYFPQGVFVFDDPSMISNLAQKEISFSGTDKWSMLNGQNGGILEGTYVVKAGSKIGDLIRRTLRLNIVGDPIEPSIDKDIAEMTISYDITKNAGETISDVLLEVALNVSAYIYYDENGRLQVFPVDNDMFKSPVYVFDKNEYNYLSATKQYQLSQIYNSVLVIGENVKNSNTPIVYEALNNDLSDPNSIPNVGFKKVKKITEYTKGIDTMEKAQARGNWELKKAKARISNVDISCLALYHLDVNQIVVLTDEHLNSKDERFLINSIEIPIGVDIQSTINLVRAVDVE